MSVGHVSLLIFAAVSLQCTRNVFGQRNEFITIKRFKNGDIFTVFSYKKGGPCKGRLATSMSPLYQDNCTVTCKCNSSHRTFSHFLDRCATDQEILDSFNCSGSVLPRDDEPLYDLTKSGRVHLYLTNFPNRLTNCNLTVVEYWKGKEKKDLLGDSGIQFNISRDENTMIWRRHSDDLRGSLLKLKLLCDGMTSQHNSCMLMRTNGTVRTDEERLNRSFCVDSLPSSTDGMLAYILIGTGIGLVFLGVFIGVAACFYRRRLVRRQQRNTVSISRGSSASRRTFKNRWSSTHKQREEPTIPAIHDVIFNGLIWDGDGGFSNQAIADPRFFEVDYGIPVDFNTFPRPESFASTASTRNSMSPLTKAPSQTLS